ncbi:hypothetical protein LSAT2_028859 [Lamellibrachia satsuma]|nr:hypothetical protein LSAT2_028859 [Lamellibrachia satsuma]
MITYKQHHSHAWFLHKEGNSGGLNTARVRLVTRTNQAFVSAYAAETVNDPSLSLNEDSDVASVYASFSSYAILTHITLFLKARRKSDPPEPPRGAKELEVTPWHHTHDCKCFWWGGGQCQWTKDGCKCDAGAGCLVYIWHKKRWHWHWCQVESDKGTRHACNAQCDVSGRDDIYNTERVLPCSKLEVTLAAPLSGIKTSRGST